MVVSLAFLSGVQMLAAVSLVAAACAVLAWWLQQKEFRKLLELQREKEEKTDAFLCAREKEAAERESLLNEQLAEARQEHEATESRLALHLNAMTRREGEMRQRREELEALLNRKQEEDVRLEREAKRAAEIERTLAEETAKVKALEQSLSLITTRAQDLARQLQDSRELVLKAQEQRMAQETETSANVAARDEALREWQLRAESLEVERVQLRAAHSTLQQMAEARLAEVQAQLDAALAELEAADVREAGETETETPAARPAEVEVSDHLRVAVSEAMQTQQRLNARIAELEYRLAEAEDRNAGVQVLIDQVSHTEALRAEVIRLTAENEALADDLETAKMARSGALLPVPEVG